MGKSIHSPQHQKLRELLIAARKKAGLTQAEVALRLGRPQSFVAKYEGGERRLDVIEFVTVARIIGLDPAKSVRIIAAQLGA
jgi:transcriptional regulator with XRE-family HTH domain